MPKKPPNLQESKLVKTGKKGVHKEKSAKIYECGCGKIFSSSKAYLWHGTKSLKSCTLWKPLAKSRPVEPTSFRSGRKEKQNKKKTFRLLTKSD